MALLLAGSSPFQKRSLLPSNTASGAGRDLWRSILAPASLMAICLACRSFFRSSSTTALDTEKQSPAQILWHSANGLLNPWGAAHDELWTKTAWSVVYAIFHRVSQPIYLHIIATQSASHNSRRNHIHTIRICCKKVVIHCKKVLLLFSIKMRRQELGPCRRLSICRKNYNFVMFRHQTLVFLPGQPRICHAI